MQGLRISIRNHFPILPIFNVDLPSASTFLSSQFNVFVVTILRVGRSIFVVSSFGLSGVIVCSGFIGASQSIRKTCTGSLLIAIILTFDGLSYKIQEHVMELILNFNFHILNLEFRILNLE